MSEQYLGVGGRMVTVDGKAVKMPQGVDGRDGVTFTPSISDNGDLSWTNDGGLANPQTVNLKGPKGDKGDKGEKGEAGPQGPQGPQGTGIYTAGDGIIIDSENSIISARLGSGLKFDTEKKIALDESFFVEYTDTEVENLYNAGE